MKLKPIKIATGEASNEDSEATYYVLGGTHVGESVARRLHAAGHSVRFVDETCDSAEIPGIRGDPADIRVLKDAGISDTSTVVVATPRDTRNLLIAQLVRTHFDASEVLVLVNHPDRYDLVAEAGHEPACATTALSDAVVDGLESTGLELDHIA